MNAFEAIILGITQGLTEFLPISSSGHLILVPWLGDFQYLHHHPAFNKTFDVALHLGTLIAVTVYFRVEIARLFRGAWSILRSRAIETPDERLTLIVAIATIPAVIAGAAGESFIEKRLGEPWQIAIFLVVFGLLLAYADRRPERRDFEKIGWRESLMIGSAQALALAPGVSRSGITITTGRFLGLTRDAAARFSFLLAFPVTGGAVVKKGADVASAGLPAGQTLPVILGVVAAAISGYLAIGGLLAYIRTRSYDAFVIYRLMVAAGILILIATGAKSATF